jgi:hypothetical protein
MCGVDAGVDIWKEEDAGMKTEVMLLFGEDHERKQKKVARSCISCLVTTRVS